MNILMRPGDVFVAKRPTTHTGVFMVFASAGPGKVYYAFSKDGGVVVRKGSIFTNSIYAYKGNIHDR